MRCWRRWACEPEEAAKLAGRLPTSSFLHPWVSRAPPERRKSVPVKVQSPSSGDTADDVTGGQCLLSRAGRPEAAHRCCPAATKRSCVARTARTRWPTACSRSSRASGLLLPDAVGILRGDGAVTDLAQWNDSDLARCVSEREVSLLTGVGHARDNTVPDEVANNRCDMPSKVNPRVEQAIACTVG